MKILFWIVIVVLIVIGAGYGIASSGYYNVSALNPHKGFTENFLSSTMDHSVKYHSRNIVAPSLNIPTMQKAGYQFYMNSCVDCHGGAGHNREKFAEGLNPDPPDLSDVVNDWTSPQLFWIVKNGVKMTGMPAFGVNLKDKEIWDVVSFVSILSKFSASEFKNPESSDENR